MVILIMPLTWNWRLTAWHHDHGCVGHVVHSSNFIVAFVVGSVIGQVKFVIFPYVVLEAVSLLKMNI